MSRGASMGITSMLLSGDFDENHVEDDEDDEDVEDG